MKINYMDIPLEYIKKDKVNEVLDFIKQKKMRKANFSYTRYLQYFNKKYQVKRTDDSVEIIYYINGILKRYKWSAYKAYDKDINNEGWSGQSSYEFVNNEYQKLKTKNKKSSLFTDISGKKYKKEYTAIKACVPSAINFIDQLSVNRIRERVYKADVSSAYPSAICGSLPTLHDCKYEDGFIQPTEEYPFAFYIKSHHLAIYNELDTRTFRKAGHLYPQYKKQANKTSWHPIDNITDETTILCKKADIDLTPIFEKLYNNRKENPEFKFIMNSFIGRCQLNSNPFLSHISAVVLARCCNKMIERCKILQKEGSYPIFISTDSIAWIGKPSSCAIFEKYLGSFTYEAYNSKFFARGLKAYQYFDLNGNCAGVCGHISKDDPRRKEFGKIPPIEGPSFFNIEEDGHITDIM